MFLKIQVFAAAFQPKHKKQSNRHLHKLYRRRNRSVATSPTTAVATSPTVAASTTIEATPTVAATTAVMATAVVAAAVMATTVMAMILALVTAGVANVGRPAAWWVVVARAGTAVLELVPSTLFVLYGGCRIVSSHVAVVAHQADKQHRHCYYNPENDGGYTRQHDALFFSLKQTNKRKTEQELPLTHKQTQKQKHTAVIKHGVLPCKSMRAQF